MALVDLFRRKYKANVWCNNCKQHSEIMIPKGVTITQFVQTGSCENCGTASLVQDYTQIDEFNKPQVHAVQHSDVFPTRPAPRQQVRTQPQPQPQPRPRVQPQPPNPRPSNQHLYPADGRVFSNKKEIGNSDYPFKRGTRPREPDWWTGEGTGIDEQKD